MILFLDFDGVLMNGRAWLLPENQAYLGRIGSIAPQEALGLRFDAVAVALAVRLVERTGGRFVLHTSWFSQLGQAAVEHLVAQGVDPALIHEDRSTCALGEEKAGCVARWLARHPHEAGPFVLIDDHDEPDLPQAVTAIRTDFMEGLGLADYAAACLALGLEDTAAGVEPVGSALRDMLRARFGNWQPAARWLLEGVPHGLSRSRLLDLSSDSELLGLLSAGALQTARQAALDALAALGKDSR